jgi:aspartyl-tRNA(Asn)/glutamyl-tRNA(Gln) amidotransferase subunit A
MFPLNELGVSQSLELLHTGKISSLELTRFCLSQIEKYEGDLHAFITLTPEKALASAKIADKKLSGLLKEKKPLPPLLGLPIAVKDVLCLQDVRCTCGSKILENFIAPFSGTAVQKLLDAGVVPLCRGVPAEVVQQSWLPAWLLQLWVLIPAAVSASRLPFAE